jgi:hypothetical protein
MHRGSGPTKPAVKPAVKPASKQIGNLDVSVKQADTKRRLAAVGLPGLHGLEAEAKEKGLGIHAKKAEVPMTKSGMPAALGGDTSAASVNPAAAPAKMPSQADHASRADMLSSFTPPSGVGHLASPPKAPAKAGPPGQLTGIAKIRAAAQERMSTLKSEDKSSKDKQAEPKPCKECGKGKCALGSNVCLDCLGK